MNGSVSFEEALFSCEFHSLFGLHPFSLLSRLWGSESIRNPRRRDDSAQQGSDRIPADLRDGDWSVKKALLFREDAPLTYFIIEY